MRVPSHCANHPSREAELRCLGCGKWLCDRCAQSFRGVAFCGPACRVRGFFASRLTAAAGALRAPVPPVWASIVVILAVLFVGWWVVRLAAELRSTSAQAVTPGVGLPYAVGEMTREGDELAVEVQGSPGATSVLIVDGVPRQIVALDQRGRGRFTDPALVDGTTVEIAALAELPETIEPLPILTPAASPERSSTPTPTQPASPSRTATFSDRASADHATGPAAKPGAATLPADVGGSTPSKLDAAGAPPILHLVIDAGPRIAVTFDGNASSNGTSELLALLEELDLEITLFVTGGFIERYPTLVRQAVLAGHEVGNHTYSHPHLTTYAENRRHDLLPQVTESAFQQQLRQTEESFRRATGRPMAPLWRAPYGEENATLRAWAMDLGYLHVRWSSLKGASLDSHDWVADEHSRMYRNSKRMVDRLLRFPRLEGGIVLMHLATERSEPPWSDLPRFVEELDKRELAQVKVTELLDASEIWRPWLERARTRHHEVFGE